MLLQATSESEEAQVLKLLRDRTGSSWEAWGRPHSRNSPEPDRAPEPSLLRRGLLCDLWHDATCRSRNAVAARAAAPEPSRCFSSARGCKSIARPKAPAQTTAHRDLDRSSAPARCGAHHSALQADLARRELLIHRVECKESVLYHLHDAKPEHAQRRRAPRTRTSCRFPSTQRGPIARGRPGGGDITGGRVAGALGRHMSANTPKGQRCGEYFDHAVVVDVAAAAP